MNIIFSDQEEGISPLDRGLIYGDGFFTTMRIQNHRPLFWDDHIFRIQTSAHRLLFPELELEFLQQQLFPNLPKEGICRLLFTRGDGPRGYAIPAEPKPNCIVMLAPLSTQLHSKDMRQLKAMICQTSAGINASLAGIKHINRLDNVLARTEVEQALCDEGLMFAGDSLVCATQANVFCVRGQEVLTPKLHQYGVDGIMKKNISRWLQSLQIPLIETQITRQILEESEEVFLSNCVSGIMKIAQLEQLDFEQRVAEASSVALQLHHHFLKALSNL
ncbi:aminodeoxychorismate lyase [Pleionea sp. CnH1-48]|uniref:aminodeoxychorismate lyase n=1 Tax=Pleionea sp. CnH1-48 TaxID=2954494 RepID=UPI002096A787|nr:aminodeoxychorismate lyase [Pleionea sp. CnH1-48]MCO7225870.1 aminodeoxychorismate lyase [Pleionea sp. CnH1-48]